jgi:DNA-damage-inducible protein J
MLEAPFLKTSRLKLPLRWLIQSVLTLQYNRNGSMSKTAHISTRINAVDKKQAEAVFKKLGITASQAIALFYKQVSLRRGIPFPVELPNQKTQEAISEARDGKLTSYASVEELKAKLAG